MSEEKNRDFSGTAYYNYITELLDQMELEIEECNRIPLSSKIVIQDHILLEYIDEIRKKMPEEFKKAQQIKSEEKKILEDAFEKREQIMETVKSKINEMTDDTQIFRQAELKAEAIVEQAKKNAAEITKSAYEYIDRSMGEFSEQLQTYLRTVEEGRIKIKETIDKLKEI